MKKLTLILGIFLFCCIVEDRASVFYVQSIQKDVIESNFIWDLYTSIESDYSLPAFEAFENGMKGYLKLLNVGMLENNNFITIIDFTKSSCEKRFWVIDIHNRIVKYHSLVAHGVNTGIEYAHEFSNSPRSNKSSIGFFLTGSIYSGKHGRSLRLDGIEEGINDNARKRALVIHEAEYVSEDFITRNGRLGRSFGCPALPANECQEIINIISDKSLIYAHFPDPSYLEKSQFLN